MLGLCRRGLSSTASTTNSLPLSLLSFYSCLYSHNKPNLPLLAQKRHSTSTQLLAVTFLPPTEPAQYKIKIHCSCCSRRMYQYGKGCINLCLAIQSFIQKRVRPTSRIKNWERNRRLFDCGFQQLSRLPLVQAVQKITSPLPVMPYNSTVLYNCSMNVRYAHKGTSEHWNSLLNQLRCKSIFCIYMQNCTMLVFLLFLIYLLEVVVSDLQYRAFLRCSLQRKITVYQAKQHTFGTHWGRSVIFLSGLK